LFFSPVVIALCNRGLFFLFASGLSEFYDHQKDFDYPDSDKNTCQQLQERRQSFHEVGDGLKNFFQHDLNLN
jgi:hypothetical protein